MGLALIADIDSVPEHIKSRACEYLIESFHTLPSGRPGFSDNVIDDAFTVYNLCERRDIIGPLLPTRLWDCVGTCAKALADVLPRYSVTPPPFGGAVDSRAYGQAVLARAVMASRLAEGDRFDERLAVAMMTTRSESLLAQVQGVTTWEPFWGKAPISRDGYGFVLMPFSPSRRTEIYQDYIKKPLRDKLKIECRRADDFYASRQIMEDVWTAINRASFVIADLSDRNPNVFYELGLAHVIGKPVILVAESTDDIPFDLRGVRTIVYGDSPHTWRNLAKQIVEYVRPIMSEVD